jgi:hypothetical protein
VGLALGAYRVEPVIVNLTHGGSVSKQLNAPFPSLFVGRIFPHGLDTLLE